MIENSSFHRFDPRIKILFFTGFITAIFFTPSRHQYKFLAYFLMLSAVFVLSRISVKDFYRKLIFLFPLLLFFAVVIFLFGDETFSEKLSILWNLSVKSVLSVLSLFILISITDFYDLVKGLELLKMPRLATSVLNFARRYSLLLIQEAERVKRAKDSRSFGKKFTKEIKAISYIVPHLFFRTLERSERIYAAMLSRGFEGEVHVLGSYKLNKMEIVLSFLFILFILFLVFV